MVIQIGKTRRFGYRVLIKASFRLQPVWALSITIMSVFKKYETKKHTQKIECLPRKCCLIRIALYVMLKKTKTLYILNDTWNRIIPKKALRCKIFWNWALWRKKTLNYIDSFISTISLNFVILSKDSSWTGLSFGEQQGENDFPLFYEKYM